MNTVAVTVVGRPTGADHRSIRRIARFKFVYNTVEAVVALAAGAAASSAALIGFGFDSVVEVLSVVAISWQFTGRRDPGDREHAALRLIAASFFLLAAVTAAGALRDLFGDGVAETSAVGLVVAAVSVVVMPGVAIYQRRLGSRIGSASVTADSHQTLLCAALSGILLVGLAVRAGFGWTWADPLAALAIAAAAVPAGINAARGEVCCASTTPDRCATAE